MRPTTPSVIRWPEKLGYAVGDTACCLFWAILSNFLNIYYTDVFGLAPAALASMLLITRLWDAAVDPIMGMVADRTSSRWGKYRPWILWGIVPYVVVEIALFYTPETGPSGKLVYAYVTYSLTMLIYTVINVPYGALLGVITPNSHERTALASYRFVGAFGGNFIVQGTLLWMIQHFGHGDDRRGYLLANAVLAVLSGLLFLYLFASTTERVAPPVEKSSVKTDLVDLLHNRPWLMLFSVCALTLVYGTFRQVTTVYYFAYYVGNKSLTASYFVSGTVLAIFGATLTPFVVRLFGSKKRTFIWLTIMVAICNGLNYFAGPEDVWLIFACNLAAALPGAAMFPLMGSMYADTADYAEWKIGRRATGLIFAGSTFAQKSGGAVGAALTNVILTFIGYRANAVQTPEALAGLRHLMSTIPATMAVGVVVLLCFYPLTAEKEQLIAHELAERRQRAAT